jgi:hypothetical protein
MCVHFPIFIYSIIGFCKKIEVFCIHLNIIFSNITIVQFCYIVSHIIIILMYINKIIFTRNCFRNNCKICCFDNKIKSFIKHDWQDSSIIIYTFHYLPIKSTHSSIHILSVSLSHASLHFIICIPEFLPYVIVNDLVVRRQLIHKAEELFP